MIRWVETPLFNALWFNLLWLSAVMGQESTLLLTALLLAGHLYAVRRRWREVQRWWLLGGSGLIIDGSLSWIGVFEFAQGQLLPLWLVAIWLAFASTLSRSLAFLGRRIWWATLLGAIAGPMSYWAGLKLGAVSFGLPLSATLLLLAFVWALLLPLLLLLSQFLDRQHFRSISVMGDDHGSS